MKLYSLRFVLALLIVGVVVGTVGMLLAFCLHEIQHLAYGYSLDKLISTEHFFEGVKSASPLRRIGALVICGVVAGVGWFLIYRYGKKLVGINEGIFADNPGMPPKETAVNSLLQVVTIALGSPLGKEGAPRQVGAMLAGELSRKLALRVDDMRLLMAGGAGAGLAAVYNVPLGGGVFALEMSWRLIKNNWFKWGVSCLILSFMAAYGARLGLGDEHQYHISQSLSISYQLVLWALLTGPIFGLGAYYFTRIMNHAKRHAPNNFKVIYMCLINFALMGILVAYLPQLAGNGKSVAQLSFTGSVSVWFALLLLVCKLAVEWGSLRSGAQGGLLTPGLANGALIGVILGTIWIHFFPGTGLGAYALVGGVAFLSSSMRMPVTAVVLTLDMTQAHLSFILPMLVCIGGSWAVMHYMSRGGK